MLASGRESEGNEGAEKRIPSVPLGRGFLGRGEGEPVEKKLTIMVSMWINPTNSNPEYG